MERLIGGANDGALRTLLASLSLSHRKAAIRDLGGHDIRPLIEALDVVDKHRPTVIFAYTIKGRGLPIEGHPNNHSALLTAAQMTDLAVATGSSLDDPWRMFPAESDAAELCRRRAGELRRDPVSAAAPELLPPTIGRAHKAPISTQAAFGRFLTDIARDAPSVASRMVTCSPDVASSTNVGGWINKMGVWSAADRHDWFADERQRILR